MVTSRICILALLYGCTAQSEFYSPQVSRADRLTVRSCGHVFEVFRREIIPGILLEMSPGTAYFRLDRGKSVRLARATLIVTNVDSGERSEISITGINTGIFPTAEHAKIYRVPEQRFGPLEEVRVAGLYEHIDMSWGEWSQWIGEFDIYHLQYSLKFPETNPTFLIEFPPFFADGVLTKVEPVEFRWIKKNTLPCLQ